MKQPQLKNASSGFHATSETSTFVQVSPPSVDSPTNVSISWLAGSLRLSNHTANTSPVAPSTASQGKNWSPGAASPDAVTPTADVSHQVAPKLPEVWIEMSAPDVWRSMLFWYANNRRLS